MKLKGTTLKIISAGLLLIGMAVHAGTVTYVYADPQGTPLAEADAQGNITATFDYRPYGTQALGQAPNGPGYTGHVNDPDTGLVYMQARYYDPGAGRFLSVDPIGPAAGNGFTFNRYAYANNNPMVNIDPDGRFPCDWCDNAGLPKGDLVRTAGEAIGADVAFVVGAATNDKALQATAVDGMREAVGGGSGKAAIASLLLMGRGGNETEMAAPSGLKETEIAVEQGPRYARGNLRKQVLDKRRQADGSVRCAYCDKPTATTSDHVVPYVKGGPTKIENLEPACSSCNSSKGAKELHTEWVPPKDKE